MFGKCPNSEAAGKRQEEEVSSRRRQGVGLGESVRMLFVLLVGFFLVFVFLFPLSSGFDVIRMR